MRRVLFVGEAGDSPCREARMEIPCEGLNSIAGWQADLCSVVFENSDGCLYGWDHETGQQLSRPHVVVLRHTEGPEREAWDAVGMIEQARKHGQRVYFDCDDDMWNLPEWNPATQWVTDEVRSIVVANMNACDGVLVSTMALMDTVKQHVDVPVHVLPAGVQPERYTIKEHEERPFRLAWFGNLKWRLPDISIVMSSLYDALDGQNGNVEFWHVGWSYDAPSIRTLVTDDFPVRITEWPWTPLSHLPWVLNMVDGVLIPQPDHPFSEARSHVFGLKCAASGLPFAFTNTEEYGRLWQYGAGYPVEHGGDWAAAINVMTAPAYKEARADMRHTGLRVARAHDQVVTAQRYVDVFDAS